MNKFNEVYLKIINEASDFYVKDKNSKENISIKNDDIVNDLTKDDSKTNIEQLVERFNKFEFLKVYRTFSNFYIKLTDENGYLQKYAIDNNYQNTKIDWHNKRGGSFLSDFKYDVEKDRLSYKDYLIKWCGHKNYKIDSFTFLSYQNNELKVELAFSPADLTAKNSGSYILTFKDVKNDIDYYDLCKKFYNAFKSPYNITEDDLKIDVLENIKDENLICEDEWDEDDYSRDYPGDWASPRNTERTKAYLEKTKSEAEEMWKEIHKRDDERVEAVKEIGNKFEKNLSINIIFCKYNSKWFKAFGELLADKAIQWFNEHKEEEE